MKRVSIVFYPQNSNRTANGYDCYIAAGRCICFADGGRRLEFYGERTPEQLKNVLLDRQEYPKELRVETVVDEYEE